MSDVIFPDGFRIFQPREAAPDYIIGDVVINVDTFTQFMRAAHAGGEIRLTLKRSKAGNVYAQLDTYRKPAQEYNPPASTPAPTETPQRAIKPPSAPNPPPFPAPPQTSHEDRCIDSAVEAGDEDLDSIPF